MSNYIWPEITKDTPIEEVKRIHKDIWNYTIKHGNKPETPYRANCAACEWSRIHNEYRCCPIIWPGLDLGGCQCVSADGTELFDQWIVAIGEEKTELARQIRDLPWKFESEENTPL